MSKYTYDDDDLTLPEATRALQAAVLTFAGHEHITNMFGIIEAMRDIVRAKGYALGYGSIVSINDGHNFKLSLAIVDEGYEHAHNVGFTFDWLIGQSTLPEMFREAARKLIALPTLSEHKRAVWQGKLKVLAEEGEALNMGFEYTQMLRATAEKLAKNALAAPVAMDTKFPAFSDGSKPETPPF